jgi:hypothetical protein
MPPEIPERLRLTFLSKIIFLSLEKRGLINFGNQGDSFMFSTL